MNSMMEYRGYHASVVYDNDDKIFVGEVFGIVDSLNFHGTSIDELTEMFHQSIDNYLEFCSQIGKEPDKEFKGSFNVRVSPELHRNAALKSAEQGISLNQFVSNAIETYCAAQLSSTTSVYYFVPCKIDNTKKTDIYDLTKFKKTSGLITEEKTYAYKN